MPKGYLAHKGKELVSIGGIGDFGADYKPREVPSDVAHQYDTPEAKAAGWVVTWEKDHRVEEKEKKEFPHTMEEKKVEDRKVAEEI